MRLPASKFILMMSTPGVDNSKHQLKHGGFLNEIMNSLADSFLHIYVAGYFGPKYISLVHIGSDTVKIDKPELKRFFILTNDEPAANQFFSPATIQYLSQWITSRPTFNRDQNVDYFGLLVSPEGIFLSCRASMENVDEVKMFSDLGVTLTKNWKNTIAQPSTAS